MESKIASNKIYRETKIYVQEFEKKNRFFFKYKIVRSKFTTRIRFIK